MSILWWRLRYESSNTSTLPYTISLAKYCCVSKWILINLLDQSLRICTCCVEKLDFLITAEGMKDLNTTNKPSMRLPTLAAEIMHQ